MSSLDEWARKHCTLVSDSTDLEKHAARVASWAFCQGNPELRHLAQEMAVDLAAFGGEHFDELLESMSRLLYVDGGASLRTDREGAVWHLDEPPPDPEYWPE
jgi:hypothetical protein